MAAALCAKLGLERHAGHGLTYDNVGAGRRHPPGRELNIGHFLVGEAIFVGLEQRDPRDAPRHGCRA